MFTERQESVLAKLQGKRAAVVGIGLRSGVPLIRFLLKAGCQVVACDRKPLEKLGEAMAALQGLPVEYQLGAGYLANLSRCDLLFRTPGMRPDLPELLEAVRASAELTSEIELVFQLAAAEITGITGSDGKTTTTTLVAEMLRADGRQVHLGGNIGHSLIEEVLEIQPTDEIVLELSSFQLMGMTESPRAALVTNLSPNHLDYHHSMAEYVSAKANIFARQAPQDLSVFNWDNQVTRELGQTAPGRVQWFSRRERVDSGACLVDGQLALVQGEQVELICAVDELVLPGWHNVENMLAAAAICRAKGVSLAAISQVARSFAGVEHRLEFVRELDGVKYYNDSIASSPTRTAAGLAALSSPVVLIAGGYDKQIPFQPLVEALAGRVRALALIGQTAPLILQALSNLPAAERATIEQEQFASLPEAVEWSRRVARPGDVVLLSPACASFDMFQDFEQRGRIFKQIVADLK